MTKRRRCGAQPYNEVIVSLFAGLSLHTTPHTSAWRSPGFWFFIAAVALSVFVRLRLLDMPFERDEGEYAYFGWLIWQGIPPYAEAYNMKLPGTYLMYALFLGLFGHSVEAVHLGLIITNLATVAALVLLGRALINHEGGWLAGGAFVLLSLSPTLLAQAAHATHFVTLFAAWGGYWLWLALQRERGWDYFGSGVVLGLAILMKQPGLFFGFFSFILIFWQSRHQPINTALRRSAVFGLGLALPLLACVAVFAALGLLPDLLFWTVLYALEYGGQVNFGQMQGHLLAILSIIVLHSGLLLLFVVILPGLLAVVSGRGLILLLLGGGIFSAASGFYFRPHYFITLLPALALLAAAGILLVTRHWRLRAALLIIISVWHGWVMQPYLFSADANSILRFYYGRANPFVETPDIAAYIKQHSAPEDRIAVLGSEPQIYFYAQRRAATGFIYTYSLMENHPYALSMQQKMAAEIESHAPRFIVLVEQPFSWLKQSRSPDYLFTWMDAYVAAHYELRVLADMRDKRFTRFYWDGAIPPQESEFIKVFERRAAPN
jgi:hypothetical protein